MCIQCQTISGSRRGSSIYFDNIFLVCLLLCWLFIRINSYVWTDIISNQTSLKFDSQPRQACACLSHNNMHSDLHTAFPCFARCSSPLHLQGAHTQRSKSRASSPGHGRMSSCKCMGRSHAALRTKSSTWCLSHDVHTPP